MPTFIMMQRLPAADTIWAKPVYDEVMGGITEGTIQEKGMGISQFQKFNIK